jgi:phosphoglucosamine mutase
MQKLFGTDGIRARAGEFPLDKKTVELIGSSLARRFARKLGRVPRFITGRDTRESGEWIESAIHAGASSNGARIESASVITTPGVAFITGCFGFDAGIVISASHNPFEDNGIKVFLPNGRKLDEATESEIERDIFENSFPVRSAEKTIVSDRASIFHDAYVDHLAGFFPGLVLDNTHIVVDCANGASCGLAAKLLRHFGARVTTINDEPNGRNINQDCGSLHLRNLQRAVVDRGANLGVAYDGDADRSLFVDEKGNVVDGDATLWILARRLKDEGRLTKSKVVATVMSNIGLELALRSHQIELDRTNVGDKYVLDELLKTGAALGGEQSGHIIFPHESLVGDGMLTTLFLLDSLKSKNQKLSDAVEGFVRYPQVLKNVRVREKRSFESVPNIAAAAAEVNGKLTGTGRLLLRYSGTENLARVMIEGQDQQEIEGLAENLAVKIKKELG